MIKKVNLKVPLAFIIGNIQGGDCIFGRSAYYLPDTRRICHMCDATPKAYGPNNTVTYKLLVMEEIKQLYID